jgi:hypothetical protein
MDFGHASVGSYDAHTLIDVPTKAEAAFAVAYLPIPIPTLDIFGKLGVARLQTRGGWTGELCPDIVGASCPPVYSFHRTDTDFAYGAGIQFRVLHFAIRAEYERVAQPSGNPDLLSVGVNWTF